MFRLILPVTLAVALCTSSLPAQEKQAPFPRLALENGDQILFLGDSITQAGHYIAFIQTYLWANYPEMKFDIINLGLGSETASGDSEPDHPFPRPCVHERIDRILAKTDPDVVFICYGMNDGIYYPPGEGRFGHYRKGINSLLEKVQKEGRDIVLMTPPPFDREAFEGEDKLKEENDPEFNYSYMHPYAEYDSVLKGYANWIVKKKAGDVALTVDLHKSMRAWLAARRKSDPDYKMGDGIHPPVEGHLAMALEILGTLGVDRSAAAAQLKTLTGITTDQSAKNSEATALWDLVTNRRRLLNQSWIEDVGHTKPKSNKAPMPLEEAKAKAEQLEEAIRSQLK